MTTTRTPPSSRRNEQADCQPALAETVSFLREVAHAYRWDHLPSSKFNDGFVMVYDGKVCGWALDPKPSHYLPGVAAVPGTGPIRWTAGGTCDQADRWADGPEDPPRILVAGSGEELAEALEQLQGSERGRRAAVAFREMLAAGATGLDVNNWRALEALCRACRMHGGYVAHKIHDALPES